MSAGQGPKYFSDEEILEAASKIKIADPTKDNGAFNSVTATDALVWLRLLGAQHFSPPGPPPDTEKDAFRRLRHALWDTQRIDYLFQGTTFVDSSSLKIQPLPSWPDWKKAHPELRNETLAVQKMDGYQDAKRLDSYVFRHFTTSAFTQAENMRGETYNIPKSIQGAWIGTKSKMHCAALDITREGKDTPFVTYFTTSESEPAMLLIEILDVKSCAWPEPSKKLMELIRETQETKFGRPADGPLVPMMQTPKFPLILVRYSYMEGRPEGGSKLTEHLQSRFASEMPDDSSVSAVREKFQSHLQSGEEMDPTHIRMFARLLSFNSSLLDPDLKNELQSHWAGLTREVIDETNISFMVPCLRLRWRALEEIETGVLIRPVDAKCHVCGNAGGMVCSKCKSVFYCGATCNKGDWKKHKNDCKMSSRLLSTPSSFPKTRFYVPVRTYVHFIPDTGFAVEQEAVKESGTTKTGECARNEYGDERFIVRTEMSAYYSHNGKFKGQEVFIWDRRRSLFLRTGPGDPVMAKERKWNYEIPFHAQGHEQYKKVLYVKGRQRQLIYLWAKRIGDVLEIDLQDVPPQGPFTWN